ncbi:ankyrin repeat domain-containing protein [Bradyrhizobium sp. HKCCYLS2038]|uniref:ankyrin repeat domain-containing protein n=1 Tax=unclassified Bradyrhizobium TaxID=2631580 RepID=UPI003EBB6508
MKAADNRADFRSFVEIVVAGDIARAVDLLDAHPQLATECCMRGASRQGARANFFDCIGHYIYAGDSAVHMAAAAQQSRIISELISRGADVHARNRRGAQPLHYAADGGPGSPAWNPEAQVKIIAALVRAGADPNALDNSGVAPLHRAVRNRCANAVMALIKAGADPRLPNKRGSTPMQLAGMNTGKSGSGSPAAKEQRLQIVRILEQYATR